MKPYKHRPTMSGADLGAFLGACKPPSCPNDPMPNLTHAEPWFADDRAYRILDQNQIEVRAPEIIARLEAQQAALHLVLAFHRGGRWTDENRILWREITGSGEATTKVMCDHIRKTLGLGST